MNSASGVPGRSVWAVGGWLLLFLLALWLLYSAPRLIVADRLSMEPRYRITAWASGKAKWNMAEWSDMQAKLQRSIQADPENPVLHDYLGALYALQGRHYWRNDTLRRAFFLDARRHQEASLRLRQVNGRTWASLALSLHALGAPPDRFIYAVRQARYYAPHDPQAHKLLVALLFVRWSDLPADLVEWTQALRIDPRTNRNGWIDRMAQQAGVR